MSIATQIADKDVWMRRGANNRIKQEIELARETVQKVADGSLHAVIISGPPGCGKNRLVRMVLEASGYKINPVAPHPSSKTVMSANPNSNVGLLDVLFRAKDGIALYDEADKTWNESTINTHKKAADPEPVNRDVVNNILGKLKVDE